MNTAKRAANYVITDTERILVQIDADNQWGFELADDDQTWPGGFGVAAFWDVLPDDDPRISTADRERLQWLLDEANA